MKTLIYCGTNNGEGLHGLLASKPWDRVYGFEANPHLYSKLKHQHANDPRIKMYNTILSDQHNVETEFYILDANKGLGDEAWLKKVITEEQKKQQKLLDEIKSKPTEKKRGKVYEAASPAEKLRLDSRIEKRRQENQAISDWLGERVDVMKSIPGLLLDEWRGEGIARKKPPKVSKEEAIAAKKETLKRIEDKFDE